MSGYSLKRLGLGIAAGAVAVSSSYAFVELYIRSRGGFGRGDLAAFWVWNAGFGLVVAFVAAVAYPYISGRTVLLRMCLSALLASALAFSYAYGVLTLLGPWFGAWSFPVFYAWLVGAVIGLGVAALSAKRE